MTRRLTGCDVARRLLHESLERELAPAEREQLATHLAGCPRCRELRDDLPGLLAGLAALPTPAMPADLREEIRGRTVDAPRARAGRLALVAAAAVLALALGLWPALHPPAAPAASPDAVAAARQVRVALAITGRGLATAGERGLALSVEGALAPALARGSRAALGAALEPPAAIAAALLRPGPRSSPVKKEVSP